jgi:hypothetical protein
MEWKPAGSAYRRLFSFGQFRSAKDCMGAKKGYYMFPFQAVEGVWRRLSKSRLT